MCFNLQNEFALHCWYVFIFVQQNVWIHNCRANFAFLCQWHFSLNLIFIFCSSNFVFKMERYTADDISVSHDSTISLSIECKTKWKDTMHTFHVTHKNLLKRFVAGRSILNITIYDFFHCVVLVRVAGLRIRCFFFSDSIDCTSVYSSDLAKMAEIMGDLDMTGLSTAIRRCWSIWFSAISLLARWRLLRWENDMSN